MMSSMSVRFEVVGKTAYNLRIAAEEKLAVLAPGIDFQISLEIKPLVEIEYTGEIFLWKADVYAEPWD